MAAASPVLPAMGVERKKTTFGLFSCFRQGPARLVFFSHALDDFFFLSWAQLTVQYVFCLKNEYYFSKLLNKVLKKNLSKGLKHNTNT
jgi:hypothetical protein